MLWCIYWSITEETWKNAHLLISNLYYTENNEYYKDTPIFILFILFQELAVLTLFSMYFLAFYNLIFTKTLKNMSNNLFSDLILLDHFHIFQFCLIFPYNTFFAPSMTYSWSFPLIFNPYIFIVLFLSLVFSPLFLICMNSTRLFVSTTLHQRRKLIGERN